MVSEPFVLQDDADLTESADDATNLLTLRVLVIITCTSTGNSGNGVASMIVMVMVFELIDYDQRSLLLL